MPREDFSLLYPLDTFYLEDGLPTPHVAEADGAEIPQPQRRLLVGAHDMTPTLEAFYGERIRLHVLQKRVTEATLSRQVLLELEESGKRVEFGAILVHLLAFPPEARAAVLECRMPLGTILSVYGVAHQSCPQAYLRVASDALCESQLLLPAPCTLYGRRNYLLTPENRILADVVELLPPHAESVPADR